MIALLLALKVLGDAAACTADDATKLSTVKFSCDAVSFAKKNFFKLAGTSKCLQDTDGVTESCANCAGQLSQCVLTHCAVHCVANPYAEGCLDCGHQHCDALAKSCTGLPLSPDPKDCASASEVLALETPAVLGDAAACTA